MPHRLKEVWHLLRDAGRKEFGEERKGSKWSGKKQAWENKVKRGIKESVKCKLVACLTEMSASSP